MSKYKDKFDKMANAPVKRLITTLAIPTILTMLVSAVYNMADSFYVGKIDTTSVAAIGVVFSIMTLLQAIGFTLGNGSGIFISTLLGQKKKDEAAKYASVAFFTAFAFGILLAVIGLFFSRQISVLLGATTTTVNAASGYLKYILLGAPFILCSFVMNNQLRYQGSAVYSMIGIVSGSILNIVIDPLFIFTFKLGVEGAAIATILSQFVGFCLLLFGTFRGENIRISIKSFKPSKKIVKNILTNGLPSLSRQGVQTVATVSLNHASAAYGDSAIAAMSIFNRIMFFGLAIVIGFGQGFQPVCSFNNGAKKYKRVIQGYKFTAITTTCIITILSVAGYIFAPQLVGIFRDDKEVIELGVRALRSQCIVMPVVGFCTSSNMMMQSLQFSGKATVLALARQGIFYVPLVLLLPLALQINGLTLAQPISDILTFILTIIIVAPQLKDLRKRAVNN